MKPTQITIKEFLAICSLHGCVVALLRKPIIEAVKFEADKRKFILNSFQSIDKFIEITGKEFKDSQLPSLKVNIYSDIEEGLLRLLIAAISIYAGVKEDCVADDIKILPEGLKILYDFVGRIRK